MKITDEAVQALEEESRIDALRIKAFKTNADADRQAYFDAVSKWFQGRHDRSAALPHLQVGYKVKRLEWEGLNDSTEFIARSIFGEYSVFIKRKSAYTCSLDGVTYERINFNPPYTLDEAKAAAQADFERRVSECIDGTIIGEGTKPVDMAEALTFAENALKGRGQYDVLEQAILKLVRALSAAQTEEEKK